MQRVAPSQVQAVRHAVPKEMPMTASLCLRQQVWDTESLKKPMTDPSALQPGQKAATAAAKMRQAPAVRSRRHHGTNQEAAEVSIANKTEVVAAAAVGRARMHRAMGADAKAIAGSEQLQRKVSGLAKALRCAD